MGHLDWKFARKLTPPLSSHAHKCVHLQYDVVSITDAGVKKYGPLTLEGNWQIADYVVYVSVPFCSVHIIISLVPTSSTVAMTEYGTCHVVFN